MPQCRQLTSWAMETTFDKVDNEIQSLLWLPQSPDLNPFENLWWDIKKALNTRLSANLNGDECEALLGANCSRSV